MRDAESAAEAPGLLHNIGWGGPQAHLTWRGFNSHPNASMEQRLGRATTQGIWIQVSYRHAYQSATGQPDDWNNAEALLRLVAPGQALAEAASRKALIELIEAQCDELEWPEFLVTGNDQSGGAQDMLRLDHALIAFVAMTKATGSLWVRRRPVRLAPLHTPHDARSLTKSAQDRQACWGTRLWFPRGIPAHLLDSIRKTSQGAST